MNYDRARYWLRIAFWVAVTLAMMKIIWDTLQ